MTITEAIIKVLQQNPQGLTSKEIYNEIVKNEFYDFGAQDPTSVVTVQLKRSCEGIKISNATPIKYFTVEKDEKGNSIYNLKL